MPRLHHVGMIVPSEAKAQAFMELFGLAEVSRGYVEQYSATCIFTAPEGGSPLELVIPDGGVLKDFNRGVGGLHHVAFVVEDIRAAAREYAEQGIQLLEAEPVRGAGAFLCNFMPPIYTRGITVELIEELPE